ncbi:hypothetical protein TARUN_9278, partial [Trichoderma arundinaceum]
NPTPRRDTLRRKLAASQPALLTEMAAGRRNSQNGGVPAVRFLTATAWRSDWALRLRQVLPASAPTEDSVSLSVVARSSSAQPASQQTGFTTASANDSQPGEKTPPALLDCPESRAERVPVPPGLRRASPKAVPDLFLPGRSSVRQTRRWAPGHTAPAFRSVSEQGRPWGHDCDEKSKGAQPVFPADALPRHSVFLDLPHSARPVSKHVPVSVWGIEHRCCLFLPCLLAFYQHYCFPSKGWTRKSDRSQIGRGSKAATIGGRAIRRPLAHRPKAQTASRTNKQRKTATATTQINSSA